MNELTAVFMDVLGKKTAQEDRAAAIVRDSMKKELSAQTEGLAASATLFVSESGSHMQRDMRALERRIGGLSRAMDAASCCKDLKKLFVRTEELHRETQREIHKKGHVRIQKLHFFYPEEQTEALQIAEELIRTELFRILALGGGEMFAACKPLRGYQHTLSDRMRYLTEEILPVTASKSFAESAKTRYWAVAHREQMRAGPMGVLPGYEITAPLKTDHWFLPGEHAMISSRSGSVMQGVGYLTNVKPDTVEQAQQRGALQTALRPEQLLRFRAHLEDPDRVLGEVFAGGLYAISPEAYYSAASFIEASAAVSRRKSTGLCLLCAQSAEGGDFCQRCVKRIKIL